MSGTYSAGLFAPLFSDEGGAAEQYLPSKSSSTAPLLGGESCHS